MLDIYSEKKIRFKPWYKRRWAIFLWVVLSIILTCLIAFALLVFYISQRIKQGEQFSFGLSTAQQVATYTGARKTLIDGIGSNYLGADNPKLTIVEFFDFACPYCKSTYPKLRFIADKYKNDVKIIIRDLPNHEFSINLALATYCAGEQGKFWEMHDLLYDNQSTTLGSSKNDFAVLTNKLGIYNSKFQECYDSQKFLYKVQKNVADSQALNISATPTWFIDGYQTQGDLSLEALQTIIDKLLTVKNIVK